MGNNNNVVLILKRRPVRDGAYIPGEAMKKVIAEQDGDKVRDMFRGLVERYHGVHDKHWLELIAGFGGKNGTAMKDWAPWLGLRSRIERLDDTVEGNTFTLSAGQATLIKKRLEDEEFILQGGLSPQLSEFIVDFCRAAGWHFEKDDDNLWFDPDEEEGGKNDNPDNR
jgi:hypothetical protein